jgi:putative protease
LHLSTQANTTNFNSVLFWKQLGIERINIARELSLEEIREITAHGAMEIEVFIHGAMCISYSGRCLLSSFLAGRDANRGMCSHPCRWKYAVVEELRPDQYLPLMEDDKGSYIFNSRDLCMIEHIPDLVEAGIDALKIEGRMKGIHYLASTVKTYRDAIDTYLKEPDRYRSRLPRWIEELSKIGHRGYCTGFFFSDPMQSVPQYEKQPSYGQTIFAGKVTAPGTDGITPFHVRNKIRVGDRIEILRKDGPALPDRIIRIVDARGESVPFAQPDSRVTVTLGREYQPNDLIRRVAPGPESDKESGDH